MTREKYLNDRKVLLNEAKTLIQEDKLEGIRGQEEGDRGAGRQVRKRGEAFANLRAMSGRCGLRSAGPCTDGGRRNPAGADGGAGI